MIRSFRNKGLRQFAATGATSKLSIQNVDRLRRILAFLDAATKPEDMNQPGFRWHPLKGVGKNRYSVSVSGNWRVTFAWDGADAIEVDLEDYH